MKRVMTTVSFQSAIQRRINPKGIGSISLGLRGTSYPRYRSQNVFNPNGVALPSSHTLQPRWGCETVWQFPRVARSSQPRANRWNPFGILYSDFRVIIGLMAILFLLVSRAGASNAPDSFRAGITAYEQNNFALAAKRFSESSTNTPSSGAFQNLGNAEWQQNHTGEAIVAWERALCLNPFDANAENNLKFAREAAQLESPELAWCEIASTWLPANAWAWIACGSLWFSASMMLVPGVLRRRKSATQQAAVALGLGVFLLSLPANYGALTRSKIGFVLKGETPLRFTPTAEAEAATRLSAGEPGRLLRVRGSYLLIRTRRTTGWVERGDFILITSK